VTIKGHPYFWPIFTLPAAIWLPGADVMNCEQGEMGQVLKLDSRFLLERTKTPMHSERRTDKV